MHDIFYFTDVHGQLDLFQSMRDWCLQQDPECMMIFGGDACDRGEFGYDIMQAILDDPQIVYIRGNHEDMFIHAAREAIKEYPEIANTPHTLADVTEIIGKCHWFHWFQLSLYNGGRTTLRDWILNGCSTAFINRLEQETTLTFCVNDICFSHAGGRYATWQRVNDAEYDGDFVDMDDEKEIIWDRNYLDSNWPANKVIVFGHTPTCYLYHYANTEYISEEEMKPFAYRGADPNGGYHIDMDTGMTFYGKGYVLNCLTMNVTGFRDPDVKKQDSKRPIEIGFENFKII